MATLRKAILGLPSGKVGQLVFSKWKGLTTVKALQGSYNDAKTDKQVLQREKFKFLVQFATTCILFVREGFASLAINMTETNAFVKYNCNRVFDNSSEELLVDYEKIQLSRGSVQSPTSIQATDTGSSINLKVSDDAEAGYNQNDVIMVCVYNVTKQLAIVNSNAGARNVGEVNIDMPSSWEGDERIVYLAMKDPDTYECSNSTWVATL